MSTCKKALGLQTKYLTTCGYLVLYIEHLFYNRTMENLPDLQPGRFLLMVMPRTLTDESIKKILIRLVLSGW